MHRLAYACGGCWHGPRVGIADGLPYVLLAWAGQLGKYSGETTGNNDMLDETKVNNLIKC